MSRWFRFYDETLNDPKAQRLSGDLFKAWVNLLCLASQNGGEIKSLADAAFALRISESKAAVVIAALAARELLDQVPDRYFAPHNWSERQYKSDVSNERVKRHRERQRNAECNVTETPDETPPDTEQITEQKDDDGGERARAFDLATELAKVCGFPSPDHWPPGWCGAPMWVQKCLSEGWLPEVMIAETRAVCKRKRDGPPENFIYLEKPLARAHASHMAPLPKVEMLPQETINGTYKTAKPRGGSVLDALEKYRHGVVGGENPNAPLSLPKG